MNKSTSVVRLNSVHRVTKDPRRIYGKFLVTSSLDAYRHLRTKVLYDSVEFNATKAIS